MHPGFRGGQPFEDYVQMHGKQVSLLKFDQICTGVFDHDQQLREFNVIVMKEKHTFLGFMLGSMAKISNHSKARQYHCTSSALHHGLSRYGHHFQACLGNMMKLTNFDKERRKHLVVAEDLAR